MFYVYGYKYIEVDDGTLKEQGTYKEETETIEQAKALCEVLAKEGSHSNVIHNGYIVYHI